MVPPLRLWRPLLTFTALTHFGQLHARTPWWYEVDRACNRARKANGPLTHVCDLPRPAVIQQLLKERCPDCDPKTIPNSGPAPVLARFSDFKVRPHSAGLACSLCSLWCSARQSG